MLRAVGQVSARTGIPILTHVPHEGCPTCALELELGHLLGFDDLDHTAHERWVGTADSTRADLDDPEPR